MSVEDKYASAADEFTAREYGDPGRYFGRRARIVAGLGVPLEPGDRVLDLAAADASAAPPLLELGLAYSGLDLTGAMVEVAHRRYGDRVSVERGDMLTWAPPQPVAATTCFRSIYFAPDRAAFLRHVAGYTEKKVLFDVDPRRVPLAGVRADLAAAGFDGFAARPFFVPQHAALPRPVAAALAAAERVPPLARLVLRVRFSLVVAGYRSGTNR